MVRAEIITRSMVVQDIAAGLRLCRNSGWNQVEADWSLFQSLGPDGCRVAERIRENCGEVVGTVATIRYEDRFSWISMMLVHPEHRRAGIGTRLLSEAVRLLGETTCIRLDATPTGRELYRQHGFMDEYPLSRFSRVGKCRNHVWAGSKSSRVREMREYDLTKILAYDREVFGADRRAVLSWLFAQSPYCAWVFTGPDREGSTVEGYCFGRAGFRYHQMGPVVARNEIIAQELVSRCLDHNDGVDFGIDVPRHSQSWLDWLTASGFVEERSFIRMHRGELRHGGVGNSVFAIIGPEFG